MKKTKLTAVITAGALILPQFILCSCTAKKTGAKIYTLDPVVTGEATEAAMDAYLTTMRKNMETLKEALQ